MAIIKYIAVHTSPYAMLKYIMRSDSENGAIVDGINCLPDLKYAHEQFKTEFEYYSGIRFEKKSSSRNESKGKKEPVRIHHYIQSFKPGEVTPEQAHEIGLEWAKSMFEPVFGANRSVIVSTHYDKEHIHNHFAVAVYDESGKRWYGNKETLKKCREVSDKILRKHGLSVIEKPQYKSNQRYSEYLARKEGMSWKQKLCNLIDNLILNDKVHSVDDLVRKLRLFGYEVNVGKYISIRPKNMKKAIRSFRLGDGYSLEHLQYRIANKNMEMSLSEALKYDGIQREYALCIRQIQLELYRKPEKDRLHISTFSEVENSLKLMQYLCDNNIKSAKDFESRIAALDESIAGFNAEKEGLLQKIESEEKLIESAPRYLELIDKDEWTSEEKDEFDTLKFVRRAGIRKPEDIERHRQMLSNLRKQLTEIEGKLSTAKGECREICRNYDAYKEHTKSDYEIMLDRARAEIERIRQEEEWRQEMIERQYRQQRRNRGGSSR